MYKTKPHNLLKENLTEIIENIFNREGSPYISDDKKCGFCTPEQPKGNLCSCQ